MHRNIVRRLMFATFFLFMTVSLSAQGDNWAGMRVYSKANAEITKTPKAVLFEDSITEIWAGMDPDFFTDNNLAGRGIGGQTTSQILVRMREDVVKLHPKYVFILAGLNDIALNPGHAVDVETAVGSIKSMCEIARANGIKPIVCSVLCSYEIHWRPEVKDCYEQILKFNGLLSAYAKKNHIKYVDYFSLLADDSGKIRPEYSKDTVHPTLEGYKVMEPYLLTFLR